MKLRMLKEHCGRLGTLLCSIVSRSMMVALAVSINVGSLALADDAAAPAAPVAVTQQVVFDGKPIYLEVMQALLATHRDLVKPEDRDAFRAKWETRHDKDDMFKSEDGTNKAIFEMVWSLGNRFDYYNPPADATAERDRMQATMAGVGMPVSQKGRMAALKALKESKSEGEKVSEEEFKAVGLSSTKNPIWVPEEPFEGGPALAAGIKKGDIILAVDGVDLTGKTVDEAVKLIRGPVGTKVKIKVLRQTDFSERVLEIEITRAQVQVRAVKYSALPGGIAHISMSHFSSQFGDQEMAAALTKAVKNGSRGIVLDLRGNPGGLVPQVLSIAQMLMSDGVIMKEVARQGNAMVTETYSATPNAFVITTDSTDGTHKETRYRRNYPVLVPAEMPIIVLINGGSASASEILSGALQKSGRAVIVGNPSHGKGVGQHVIPIDGGKRNIHVTNFEFLPGGEHIDWVGVIPDVEVTMPDFVDAVEDPNSDTQLVQAKTELLALLSGVKAPKRDAAEVARRQAELLKEHKEDFQKEVEGRDKWIAAPLETKDASQ